MGVSPAKAHFMRKTAELEAAKAAASGNQLAGSTGYELMLAKVDSDMRRLKTVQSVDRKIEVKRELLPDYEAYIDGALSGDSGVQDDVLMTVMVWHIDVGNYDRALQIAEYAIRHKLVLPGQYQRTLGTLIVEEISDAVRKALASGIDAAPLLEPCVTADKLTENEDMPDQSRARLYKAIGLIIVSDLPEADSVTPENAADHRLAAETALDYLSRAVAKDQNAGVKKDIERLQRYIKNLPAPSGTDGQ